MFENMGPEKRATVKNSVGRLAFAGLCILFQISWLLLLAFRLNAYSAWISLATNMAAFALAFHIYGKYTNAAFKMPWIIVLLVFPMLGLCLYGLFGHVGLLGKKKQLQFKQLDQELFALNPQKEDVMKRLESEDYAIANQCRYITNYGGYPVFDNTEVEFYPDAAQGFEAQIAAIEKAEKFVFMEYHAIEEAHAFDRLKAVLARKAAMGVEVRFFYDDVGSGVFIDRSFIKRMEDIGVQCRVFNPVSPVFNLFMNNRDHRKITVVDGKVGFTGGYNLADEYFNITHPYGHWKDTGVKLTGEAVKNLTVIFLEMWNAMKKTDTDYQKYLEAGYCSDEEAESAAQTAGVPCGCGEENAPGMGFVQPYGDSPLDGEPVGENVYLNMIKYAKRRLYVATPYLIISDEMNRELGLAAKRGVDVRVITPGIPDKKTIYKVTRSYYAGLVRQGVRVYEYTPGFLHEKQVLCDESCAAVGTINFDYRSLYHHFENGVFLYKCSAIGDIARDFEDTLEKCSDVTEYYRSGRSAVLRGTQKLLKLFAPLL